MKLIKSIILTCIGIIISPYSYANIDLVAEPGMQAVGFPSNYVYESIRYPVIGRGGHIAFTGAADISINPTPNNAAAIWAGFPGQLHAVIKDGEVPAGFPAEAAFIDTQGSLILITGSGMVVARATFGGPVNGLGLIAEVDGDVIGIVKEGDQAPGFPVGVTTERIYERIVASEAGIAYIASTSIFESAIWYWDKQTQTVQLVAKRLDDVSSAYPGCGYSSLTSSFNTLSINDDGDIVFSASLFGANCPFSAIVRWNRGNLYPVVSVDDTVPGMPLNVVSSSLPYSDAVNLNDSGSVAYLNQLLDQNTADTAVSAWVMQKNAALELLALTGEVMPALPEKITTLGPVHTNVAGKSVVSVRTTSNSVSILFGMPKTSFGYPNLVDVGQSHLSELLNEGDQLPGFGATWFVETIDGSVINNQGDIAVAAEVRDALNLNGSATWGIWSGKDASTLKLIAKEGMAITANGTNDTLTLIRSITSGGSTNGGRPVRMSDDGQIIFMGSRTGNPAGSHSASSVFITRLPTKSDVVIDLGSIGLWSFMNNGLWQKLNNTSPDDVVTGDVDGNGVDDVIADFGSMYGGIFIKRDGGTWVQLHNYSSQSMATGDLDGNGRDDIVLDFGGIGLWAYMNDATWLKLNNSSPDDVVITDMDGNGADDVIADFGSTFGGIFAKRNQGVWSKLYNNSALSMTTGDLDGNGSGDVIINFGGTGLWARMNNAFWLKLHNGSPDSVTAGDVDGNGADDVVASFGSTIGGVWQKLNLGGWTRLNNNAPDKIVMGDMDANGQSDLIGAFNSTLGGIFVRRNNGAWSKLHNNNPDDLAAGDLDGI